jgi:hypothetical protein
MAAAADKRANLDLQVNLLAEHEVTKVAAMLATVMEHLGIPVYQDHEVHEVPGTSRLRLFWMNWRGRHRTPQPQTPPEVLSLTRRRPRNNACNPARPPLNSLSVGCSQIALCAERPQSE